MDIKQEPEEIGWDTEIKPACTLRFDIPKNRPNSPDGHSYVKQENAEDVQCKVEADPLDVPPIKVERLEYPVEFCDREDFEDIKDIKTCDDTFEEYSSTHGAPLNQNSSATQATFSLAPSPSVSSASLTPLRSCSCSSTNSKQSKKKKEQADHQAFMAACTNALQEKEKDFADTVGAHVTERLRKIDPRKQLLVNYLINRTLCKAENEKLNTTSVITFGEDYFSDIGV